MSRHFWFVICALAFIVGFGSPASHAQVVYDPAADFSATNNPNGVWSYGWTTALGSAFNASTSFQNGSGLDFWVGPFPNGSSELMPYVAHNGTSSMIAYHGNLLYPPGQLGLHPGPGGEYAVIRFTAQQATVINIVGQYFWIPTENAASTDVHLFHNNVAFFNGALGSSGTAPFSLERSVLPGDNIDFVVGFGGNGFAGDSTGLAATITPIPEPSALTLTGLTIAAAIGSRLRRRNLNVKAD